MTKSIVLLPCPFCGSKADASSERITRFHGHAWCSNSACGVDVYAATEAGVIRIWNNRPVASTAPAISDALPASIPTPIGVVPCKVGTQPWSVVVNRSRRTIKVGDVISIREAGVGHKWIRVLVENLEPLRVSR